MVACSVLGQAALVIGVEDATLGHWDADAWLSGATQHPADVSLAPEWMSASADLGESISPGCEDQPSWAADCPNLAEHCGRSLAMKIKCRKTCGCGPKVHDPIPNVGGNNTNSTGPKKNNAQMETKVMRSQKQLDISLEMDAESFMQVEETVTARTHTAARNGTRENDPACVDEPSWAADCNHLSTHCAESMVMKIKCRKTCGCGEYIPDPIQAKNEDSLEPSSLSPEDAKKAAKAAAEATKKAESLTNIKPVIAGETQVQRATKAAASLSAEEASKKAAQDKRRAATKKEEKARAEVDKAKIDKEANDLEKMEKDISKQTAVTVVKPKPKENVGKKAAADAKADEQKAAKEKADNDAKADAQKVAKEKADNDAKADEQKAKNDQQKDMQTKDAASKAKKIQKEIKDTEANAAKDENKELKKEDAKEAATKKATKKPAAKEEAKPASKETAKPAAKEDAKKPTTKETEKKSSAQMRAEADADLAESNAELKAEGDDDEDDDELFVDDDALLEVSEGHVPPNEKEKQQWEEARKAAQVLVAKVVAAGKENGAREAKAAAQLAKGTVRSTRASTHNHPDPGN